MPISAFVLVIIVFDDYSIPDRCLLYHADHCFRHYDHSIHVVIKFVSAFVFDDYSIPDHSLFMSQQIAAKLVFQNIFRIHLASIPIRLWSSPVNCTFWKRNLVLKFLRRKDKGTSLHIHYYPSFDIILRLPENRSFRIYSEFLWHQFQLDGDHLIWIPVLAKD